MTASTHLHLPPGLRPGVAPGPGDARAEPWPPRPPALQPGRNQQQAWLREMERARQDSHDAGQRSAARACAPVLDDAAHPPQAVPPTVSPAAAATAPPWRTVPQMTAPALQPMGAPAATRLAASGAAAAAVQRITAGLAPAPSPLRPQPVLATRQTAAAPPPSPAQPCDAWTRQHLHVHSSATDVQVWIRDAHLPADAARQVARQVLRDEQRHPMHPHDTGPRPADRRPAGSVRTVRIWLNGQPLTTPDGPTPPRT